VDDRVLEETAHDVACVGILVADLFASPIQRLPNPGELTPTSGLIMSVGGSAANTAAALRILGQRVVVAGKVGEDMQGDFVITQLQRRGIDVSHIRRTSKCSTSGTVVLTVAGEDRRYLHCIGANAEFNLNDLDYSIIQDAKVLYLGGYLAMPSFTVNQLTDLFRRAKASGRTTVLDVAIPAGAESGLEHVAPALAYTDYFLPNNEEAAQLTGYTDERFQAKCFGEVNSECVVVITRGSAGSLVLHGGQFMDLPPFPMDSVDESGAGDAFAAGLIAAVREEWDLERALRFAAAVGASCTRAMGCAAGIFTFDEATAFLQRKASTLAPSVTLA
jgi:sugar/nucleoside kinase (ribokinase family)